MRPISYLLRMAGGSNSLLNGVRNTPLPGRNQGGRNQGGRNQVEETMVEEAGRSGGGGLFGGLLTAVLVQLYLDIKHRVVWGRLSIKRLQIL